MTEEVRVKVIAMDLLEDVKKALVDLQSECVANEYSMIEVLKMLHNAVHEYYTRFGEGNAGIFTSDGIEKHVLEAKELTYPLLSDGTMLNVYKHIGWQSICPEVPEDTTVTDIVVSDHLGVVCS